MTSSQQNRTQLTASADAVGQRTAGGSVADITAEHVEILREAGVTDATIAQLLRDAGMEEGDVSGFAAGDPGTTDPGIVVQTICLGTCPRFTIVVSATSQCKPR